MKEQTPPQRVKDIMTVGVVSVEESDDIAQLLDAMAALKFRHLPVTDDDRLLGLLSERDVLMLSASTLLPHARQQDRQMHARVRVADVMTREVVTAHPDMPLSEAAALLLRHRIGCLPVVDEDNVLRGILTGSDLIRVVAEH